MRCGLDPNKSLPDLCGKITGFLRGVLLHYFHMKKVAVDSNIILVGIYNEHVFDEKICTKTFCKWEILKKN